MSKKYRPIYECDKCHKEFDDSTKVRSFEGSVTDGEGDIIFIDNSSNLESEELFCSMYCMECIPEILLSGKKSEEKSGLDEIKKILNIEDKYLKSAENYNFIEDVNELYNQEKNIIIHEEDSNFGPKLIDLSNTEVQHNLIVDSNPYKKEVEIPKENISTNLLESSTEDKFEQFEAIELLEDGEYLVLYQITNDEQEEYISKQYGHPDIQSLRDSYGGPLIGLYISSNGFINNIPKNLQLNVINVINKVIFGIPNVVIKNAFIQNGIAYILKQDFDLHIESIKISKPNVEEKIPTYPIIEKKEENIEEEIPIDEFDDDYI